MSFLKLFGLIIFGIFLWCNFLSLNFFEIYPRLLQLPLFQVGLGVIFGLFVMVKLFSKKAKV